MHPGTEFKQLLNYSGILLGVATPDTDIGPLLRNAFGETQANTAITASDKCHLAA